MYESCSNYGMKGARALSAYIVGHIVNKNGDAQRMEPLCLECRDYNPM